MNRRYLVPVAVVVVLLLALGALPQFLGSGPPYHATAVAVEETGNATESVNGSALSERRYRYVTAALDEGESGTYRKGPVGFKRAFTHSPFDELAALRGQFPNATDGHAVYVSRNGTVYRVTVERADT
jgi:hypothetical protein